MIAYKVVYRHKKRLSVMASFDNRLIPFSLEYKKGATVIAPRGTVGIMLFETEDQAKGCISCLCYQPRMSIIKVKYKRKLNRTYILNPDTSILLEFFNKKAKSLIEYNKLISTFYNRKFPPAGTIIVRQCKVLT